MLTKAEVFNETARYLFSMKEQCVDSDENCLYRNDSGNRCAVGYWIDDNHPAASKTLVAGVKELINRFPKDGKHPLREEIYKYENLMRALQCVHDDPCNWNFDGFSEYGKYSLKEVALRFKIKWTF